VGSAPPRSSTCPTAPGHAYEAVSVGAFVDGGGAVYTTIHRWGDWNEMKLEGDRVMRMS
jgi:hypothetical protein